MEWRLFYCHGAIWSDGLTTWVWMGWGGLSADPGLSWGYSLDMEIAVRTDILYQAG